MIFEMSTGNYWLMSRTGTGETPPPETLFPVGVGLQPATFKIIASILPFPPPVTLFNTELEESSHNRIHVTGCSIAQSDSVVQRDRYDRVAPTYIRGTLQCGIWVIVSASYLGRAPRPTGFSKQILSLPCPPVIGMN
jgi:hypothetical protein